MSEVSPEHLERRKVLIQLEFTIDEASTHKFDVSQLKELGVDVRAMSLDRGSSCNPSFFAQHDSLPKPDEDTIEEVHSNFFCEDTCFTRPVDRARQVQGPWFSYIPYWGYGKREDSFWTVKDVAEYTPYKCLYECDQPEFCTAHMTDIRGKEFPHIKANMWSNLNAENGVILRSELLTILRLMLGHLRKRRFLQHMIAPIFLISFMGKRARAFESYFDGQALILRTSELYEFPEQTSTAFPTLAEWYLSMPIGDTS